MARFSGLVCPHGRWSWWAISGEPQQESEDADKEKLTEKWDWLREGGKPGAEEQELQPSAEEQAVGTVNESADVTAKDTPLGEWKQPWEEH